jgi:hypothetical protein
LLGGLAAAVFGASNAPVAQRLIEEEVARHTDVATIAMHVTPPGAAGDSIIASNVATLIGKESGQFAVSVTKLSRFILAPEPQNAKFEVLLPLKDHAGTTIGTLAVVFSKFDGKEGHEMEYFERALGVRNRLRGKIASLDELCKR